MPTYPLSNDVWRDLVKACRGCWISKNEVERRIELPGGGSITVKSADKPDTLRGTGLDGIVLDEAAMILEEAWRLALRPALIDKQGWAAFLTTPKGLNWFHELFERAATDGAWERWQQPTSNNPVVPAGEIADLTKDMSGLQIAQEIHAQFVNFGGGSFQRPWFPIVAELPAGCSRAIRYWDKAATEDGGDYSAGSLVTVHDGTFYIADMIRGRWSAHNRETVIAQTTQADAARWSDYQVWIEQEPGSGGKESAELTIRRLAGYRVHAERVTGEKHTRWGPLAAQAEAGNVRLVKGDWNKPFLDEIEAVPNGRHDDQADAAAGAFNKLAPPARPFEAAVYVNGKRVGAEAEVPAGPPVPPGMERYHSWTRRGRS